jgi:hypothetical protein
VQSKAPWWVGTVLALAVVVAFAWFVWPTPWRPFLVTGVRRTTVELREHRLTGELQARLREGLSWSEWVTVDEDSARRLRTP